MNPEKAYQLMLSNEFQATIFGVLRHLDLKPSQSIYEDYVQEAWVVFYLWLQEPQATNLNAKQQRSIGYTRMYRHLVNLLIHDQRHAQRRDDGDVPSVMQLITNDTPKWQLDWLGLPLSTRQLKIIWYLVEYGENQQVVAQKLGVNRKTIQRELSAIRKIIRANNLIAEVKKCKI